MWVRPPHWPPSVRGLPSLSLAGSHIKQPSLLYIIEIHLNETMIQIDV